MDKLRLVLKKIQCFIEMQNGATESQLKSLWNDISDYITESEVKNEEIRESGESFCECKYPYTTRDLQGIAYCSKCNNYFAE